MNKRVLCALVGAAVCAVAHQASAEIPLASAKGWELSLDGRLNTFLSVAFGDALPAGEQIWQGFYDYGDGILRCLAFAPGSFRTSWDLR